MGNFLICAIHLIIVVLFQITQVVCDYGILHAKREKQSGDFCIEYNPYFGELPLTLQENQYLNISDLTNSHICTDLKKIPNPGTVWAIDRDNCTFSEKAVIVQKYGGKGVLVISKNGLLVPSASNTTDYDKINITMAIIKEEDFLKLKSFGNNTEVQFYAPSAGYFDFNLLIMWLIAVGTVGVGGYVSGIAKHKIYMKQMRKKRGEIEPNATTEEEEEEKPLSENITPQSVIILVVCIIGMLLALYFFYDYLRYLVIAMFALGSSTALYGALKPVLLRTPCIGSCKSPPINVKLPCYKNKIEVEVRRVILALLCLGVGAFWIVFRREPWAWILQDILGILLNIHLIKLLRLPSLKIITLLFVMLFLYDIFFVFISPLITKQKQSIMERVALGGKSGEELPVIFKVVYLNSPTVSVCGRAYSMLGFGDVAIPGLLVAYCHGFDLKVGSKRIYYIASLTAYGLGLVTTFISLHLMKTAQPALLYLVPFTLLTTFTIALCRKEVKQMWIGDVMDQKKKDGRSKSINDAENADDNERNDEERDGQNRSGENQARRRSNIDDDAASDTSNEQQSLLSPLGN